MSLSTTFKQTSPANPTLYEYSIVNLLSAGDHIVSMDDIYGGTNRFFRKVASRMNIETSFVDATIASNIEDAIRPNTRMVWIETPTNPTLKIVDIRAVSKVVAKFKQKQSIFPCGGQHLRVLLLPKAPGAGCGRLLLQSDKVHEWALRRHNGRCLPQRQLSL